MTHHQRSGATGASSAVTMDRAAPSAATVHSDSDLTTPIPVGSEPHDVAVSPLTGDVYVTNFNDGTASVISGRTNTVTATILVGNGPVGVAVSPLTGDVYVANVDDGTVVGDLPANTMRGLERMKRQLVRMRTGTFGLPGPGRGGC